MELSQLGFLEELLAPKRDTWNNNALSTGLNEILLPSSNGWSNFEYSFDENPSLATLNPSFATLFSTPIDHRFEAPYGTTSSEVTQASSYPFVVDGFTMPGLDSSLPLFPPQQEENNNNNNSSSRTMEDEEFGFLGSGDNNNNNNNQSLEERNGGCKVEEQVDDEVPLFKMGMCGADKKITKSRKLEGQPSKNLMAERRRRKRLNDRLSMLRSIVPKISKMDRTSILGDTIDYMKELLERIGKLQEEAAMNEGTNNNQIHLLEISKDLKSNEAMLRNSPKFDVERREQDTRISICCATKPGLLLSTVNTLEALGLEIHQCVISSFSDFSMQATCSEGAEQRDCISPEEVKQALFRNAGYGGRCV